MLLLLLFLLLICYCAKIKAILETWDMAGEPEKPIPVFTSWRHLLRESETSSTTIPSTDRWGPNRNNYFLWE